MAAILVAPLFIAYDSLNSMRAAVRGIRDQDLNATLLLTRIRTAGEELRQAELQLAYATDSGPGAQSGTRVAAAVNQWRLLSDSLSAYGLGGSRSEIAATLDRLEAAIPMEFEAVRRGK